jgi:heme-degrading monooxygenase HmoA
MAEVWSAGTWTVKEGAEDAFVERWRTFAEWSAETHGPAHAWLLRDRDDPRRFISVGPWPGDEAVAAWRDDPGFRERIGGLRELLDGFEARTLDPVATAGG